MVNIKSLNNCSVVSEYKYLNYQIKIFTSSYNRFATLITFETLYRAVTLFYDCESVEYFEDIVEGIVDAIFDSL